MAMNTRPGARLDPARFDLQGHRGARGLAPENTLLAFAKALTIGVTTLELDTAVTSDGIVVVAHDRRLNPDITRDAQGHWLTAVTPTVCSLSFEELKQFDVGRIDPRSPYFKRFPDQQGRDRIPMPSLAQVFELVSRSGNKRVRFNIETKLSPLCPDETPAPQDFVKALLDTIMRAGFLSRVTIQSFDWRTLRLARQQQADCPISFLSVQQAPHATIKSNSNAAWTDAIRLLDHHSVPRMIMAAIRGTFDRESTAVPTSRMTPSASTAGVIWSPHYNDLDEKALDEAHQLGIAVIPWTLNDPADIAHAIDLGVDGLITDYPDRAREVMAQKQLELPPSTPLTGCK